MTLNFKIVVQTVQTRRTFIIRPYLNDFHNFKEEIYMRMPHLKGKQLEFYYDGKFEILDVDFLINIILLIQMIISNFNLKLSFVSRC